MSQNAHRIAVFNWLRTQSELYEEVIPRKILEEGFTYYNQRITLVGPSGIWKPAGMELPLSITTVSDGPYSDSFDANGLLRYSYRGTNVNHRDNIGLRYAMQNQVPLEHGASFNLHYQQMEDTFHNRGMIKKQRKMMLSEISKNHKK